MLAFVLLLLSPILVAFRAAWRFRRDARGDFLLGLGFALVVVAVHSFYEWVFITFYTQYIFAIVSGLIVGVARQLGYWSPNSSTRARKQIFSPSPVSAEASALATVEPALKA